MGGGGGGETCYNYLELEESSIIHFCMYLLSSRRLTLSCALVGCIMASDGKLASASDI